MLMTVAPSPALRQTQRGTSHHPQQQYQAYTDPADYNTSDPAAAALAFSTNMNGIIRTAPPGTIYVRALYDYEADDRTSLSFHEGDIIQVITQLESGWWDGVINGVRGWFPSNYCQIVSTTDEMPQSAQNGMLVAQDDEFEDQVRYEEEYEDDNESDQEDFNGLPLEGTDIGVKSAGAEFWIPQATRDGRLFYYNTMTGESSMELPLESPTSLNEMGPMDRMNVNMPEKTRPPPEMMARGLTQDEDEDSEAASASELENDSLMMAPRGSAVSIMLCHQFRLPERTVARILYVIAYEYDVVFTSSPAYLHKWRRRNFTCALDGFHERSFACNACPRRYLHQHKSAGRNRFRPDPDAGFSYFLYRRQLQPPSSRYHTSLLLR